MIPPSPTDGPRPRGDALRRQLRRWLAPLVSVGLLGLAWQLYAQHNPYVLPTLPQIGHQFRAAPGLYWHDTLVTLREALVGAAGGMTIGFLLAVAMSRLPLVERAVMPLAVALNVTPVIAIAPGLVVAFGFGYLPKYIIAGVVVVFPFLINSLMGLRSADHGLLDVFRTWHASSWRVLWHLELPSSLPYVLAAARICVPLSVVGAVVGEFSAAGQTTGLGSLIEVAANQANLAIVYAAVAVLALLGISLTLVVVALQHALRNWSPVTRARPW
ncbi:MAG: ABC transporter permease [Acidimicrobiales bacterium]